MKDLLKRLSVAVWGIPLIVYICYQGGVFFYVFILIVSSLAIWEFYSIFKNKEYYAFRYLGLFLNIAFVSTAYFFPQYWIHALLAGFSVSLLAQLLRQSSMASGNTAFLATGFVYISVILSILMQIRVNFDDWFPELSAQIPHAGGYYLIVLLASIWICDTAAYFGGKMTGKHKLAPSISPNKTVEGGLWGLLFGVVSFYGLTELFLPGFSPYYSIASGLIVGIFGQLGDLVESRFKRDAGVKDTSTLLPGHGGFLDRFDSLIFVSPFLWIMFNL